MKIKEKLDKNQNIVFFIISIFITIGLSLQVNVNMQSVYCNGLDFVWVLVFSFCFMVLKKAYEYRQKRLVITSCIVGLFLATCQTLGIIANSFWMNGQINFNVSIVGFVITKWIVFTVLFTAIIMCLYALLEKKKDKKGEDNILKANKKWLFIVFGILFVAWLPYFLNFYPGITSFDTNYQLMQGLEVYPYTNHHPVFHTFIITFLVKIGVKLTGSYTIGIAICSIVQMLVCASILSFAIYYMAKKKIPLCYRAMTLAFFALCPVIPQLSIAIWKDVPFAFMMVLFLIGIIEVITNSEKFLKSIKWNIISIIVIALIMFFRNNGLYIILLTFPVLLIIKRSYYKRILPVFLLPLAFYFIITGPVYENNNIEKSSPREMLTVPIQQFARVAKFEEKNLTEEEKQLLHNFFPNANIATLYDARISDPVKNEFNNASYEANKKELLKLYAKFAIKYPQETIAAFVCGSFGYYYPNTVTYPITHGVFEVQQENEKFTNIKKTPIVSIPILDHLLDAMYEKQIPVLNWLANIGIMFWIVILALGYGIYTKKYNQIIYYVPFAILYLTTLVSPVSGELRYVYGLFLAMPLLVGFALKQENKEKEV